MHCKTVSNNSLAKDKDSTDQSQTAVVQNLLLSREKGGQSIVSMDHPSLSYHEKIQQKERIQSYEAVKHDAQDFTKAVDISSSLSPHSLDDEIKSFGQLSPSVYESLWNGTIQLSSTAKVSVVAFFKRNMDLLDIGSNSFKTLVQVAENFEVSQKVGFADICDGYSLYVCPRSDAVITILAKCGFFKGMSAVDTNQDSLMGCIVWRRKGSPSTPCSNDPGVDSSRNIRKIQDDIEKTQEIQSTSVKTHAVATESYGGCLFGKETTRIHINAAESSKHQENHPFVLQPDSCGAHRPIDTDDLPELDFTTLCGADVKHNTNASQLGVPLYQQIKAQFFLLYYKIKSLFLVIAVLL
ncbi:hypothetical protein GUJ93_ZPchr0458g22822 [Zizania palustris]|uniref:Uncharacterized protein n=1 Tax=Zizania palustris TaxID=103762 RepID=A0A8J5RLA7_ZIZPA|nr:hypothetical protein GUJ93_ZPchr0458g22822 [Zizania palustris]